MNKETSSRVSTIAAEIMRTTSPLASIDSGQGIQFIERRIYDELLEKAKTLAGSCMSQDETPGQGSTNNFLDRLKRERADLSTKVDGLGIFLSNNAPGATPLHKEMLGRQLMAMSEYLAILDERLADLAITERSAPVEEIPIGNEDDR